MLIFIRCSLLIVESHPCTKHVWCLMARSSRWQYPTRVMHSESDWRCFAIARATERAIRGRRLGANRFRPKSDGFICGRRCTAAFKSKKSRAVDLLDTSCCATMVCWSYGWLAWIEIDRVPCHCYFLEARAERPAPAVKGEKRGENSSLLGLKNPGRPWLTGELFGTQNPADRDSGVREILATGPLDNFRSSFDL